jgi:hypothetical protein
MRDEVLRGGGGAKGTGNLDLDTKNRTGAEY